MLSSEIIIMSRYTEIIIISGKENFYTMLLLLLSDTYTLTFALFQEEQEAQRDNVSATLFCFLKI